MATIKPHTLHLNFHLIKKASENFTICPKVSVWWGKQKILETNSYQVYLMFQGINIK